MSTYSNRLQPALQNLLRVVRFFHPRSSCMTTHISADVQRITLNASCMMTKQLDIFCCITGITSDFLSFVLWNLFASFMEPFNCYLSLFKENIGELLCLPRRKSEVHTYFHPGLRLKRDRATVKNNMAHRGRAV